MATGVQKMHRRKRPNPRRDRIELRADAEWIEQVVEAANRLGLGLSSYIRLAINERLMRDGFNTEPKKGQGPKG